MHIITQPLFKYPFHLMITIVIGFITLPKVHGDLLAYEGFDYALGADLNNQSGGGGWSGGWTTSGSYGGDTDMVNGWNITGVTSQGSAWRMDDYSSGTVSRTLSDSVGIVGGSATHNEVWVSTMLLHNRSSFGYTFSLSGTEGTALTIKGGQNDIADPGIDHSIRTTVQGSTYTSDVVSIPAVFTDLSTPTYALMKMAFSPSDSTTVDVWLFAIGESIPQTEGALPSGGGQHYQWTSVSDFNFNTVSFGGYSFQISQVDEIRVATTLDDALHGTTVIPEPDSVLLLMVGFGVLSFFRLRKNRI